MGSPSVWFSWLQFYVILKNSGCPLPHWYFTKSPFVDDIFLIILCQSHQKDFVKYVNTKHPNIKFTSEFGSSSYSFLDVKITRRNNQLVTSVFRMATFSGVFTIFKSCMPVVYKFGLVYILLHRSFFICSSYENFMRK